MREQLLDLEGLIPLGGMQTSQAAPLFVEGTAKAYLDGGEDRDSTKSQES